MYFYSGVSINVCSTIKQKSHRIRRTIRFHRPAEGVANQKKNPSGASVERMKSTVAKASIVWRVDAATIRTSAEIGRQQIAKNSRKVHCT
jgi:hypothetical protein